MELAGGRTVHVALDAETFAPDWPNVRAAITRKTRMIVTNSPHNPSGATLSAADMRELGAIVAEHDLYLLSDEVYEHIVFDGARHESALLYPELRARAFVISSLGKTYHCTGWKVGYAIAPPALSAEMRKVHQYNTFCSGCSVCRGRFCSASSCSPPRFCLCWASTKHAESPQRTNAARAMRTGLSTTVDTASARAKASTYFTHAIQAEPNKTLNSLI